MATRSGDDAELGAALLAIGRRLQGVADLKTAETSLAAEVFALNDAVRTLADERLGFWDDPAHFARVLRADDEPAR